MTCKITGEAHNIDNMTGKCKSCFTKVRMSYSELFNELQWNLEALEDRVKTLEDSNNPLR